MMSRISQLSCSFGSPLSLFTPKFLDQETVWKIPMNGVDTQEPLQISKFGCRHGKILLVTFRIQHIDIGALLSLTIQKSQLRLRIQIT